MKTDKKSDDNRLWVFYKDKKVGTLAMTATRKVAFEYDDEWIAEGFSISPFSLPLRKEVFIPKKDYFDGLFGVFADSLPDAWGRILLSRFLKEKGIDEESITVLDRLAMMGSSGMGALKSILKPHRGYWIWMSWHSNVGRFSMRSIQRGWTSYMLWAEQVVEPDPRF